MDRARPAALALLGSMIGLGCPRGLPEPPARPSDAGALTLRIEPRAELDAAPRVVHLRVSGLEQGDGGPGLLVFSGELSSYDLGRVRRSELGSALTERRIRTIEYTDGLDEVVAPLEVLALGQTYSVVTASGEIVGTFAVPAGADAPFERLWPPLDGGSGVEHVVYCADGGTTMGGESIELSPGDLPARIAPGAGSGPDGSGCIHLSAAAVPPRNSVVVGPPAVQGRPLDPAPLVAPALDAQPLRALPCEPDEVEFGAGCARVSDDRIGVRSAEQPLLWILSGGLSAVRSAAPLGQVDIGGLRPSTAYHVAVGMVDLASRFYVTDVDFRTLVAAPHIVINEVLANSVGPEPQEEWVELFNDGRAAVELGGWQLQDAGGTAVLPAQTLDPGQYALVVNVAFDASSGLDIAPAPNTLLLRVDRLGKNGLSNSGEPLRLLTPEGKVVSTFPAISAPTAGVSAARRTPSASDTDPASFGPHADPGASPGAPNVLAP